MTARVNSKWIWFDLDDTLHNYSDAATKAASLIFPILADRAYLPVTTVKENYQLSLKGHINAGFTDGRNSYQYRGERFQSAIRESKLTVEQANDLIKDMLSTYESIFMEGLKLKDGAVELLNSIKNSGYMLALLSDAPHDAQIRVINKLGLGYYFDEIFTSGDLKITKSNGMLQAILDKLQILPENTIMIGDSPERDILPALSLKINAIWLNEKLSPNKYNCHMAHSLEKISNMVAKIYK